MTSLLSVCSASIIPFYCTGTFLVPWSPGKLGLLWRPGAPASSSLRRTPRCQPWPLRRWLKKLEFLLVSQGCFGGLKLCKLLKYAFLIYYQQRFITERILKIEPYKIRKWKNESLKCGYLIFHLYLSCILQILLLFYFSSFGGQL